MFPVYIICFFNNLDFTVYFSNNVRVDGVEMSLMNNRIGIYSNMCFEYMPVLRLKALDFTVEVYSYVLCSLTESVHSVSDVIQMAPRLPGVVTIDGETPRRKIYQRGRPLWQEKLSFMQSKQAKDRKRIKSRNLFQM